MRPDHRKITAAARREKTRARLVEAAVMAVAARGMANVVIDDIVAEAGLARGTFYTYFDQLQTCLYEAKALVLREMVALVLAEGSAMTDPAEALATDLLTFFETFRRYPLLVHFKEDLMTPEPWALGQSLMEDALVPYLDWGMSTGRFCKMPHKLVLNFIQTGGYCVVIELEDGVQMDSREVTSALLRLLGLSRDEARCLSETPVRHLSEHPDSLLSRANEVYRASLPGAAPRDPDVA